MRKTRRATRFAPGIILLACLAAPVMAGDLYVTTTADTTDGICSPLIPPCSLRDAIRTANARAGHDTVHLPAGTYVLSIAGAGEENAETGDLDILDDITLLGSGAEDTIVDAAGIDRVFHVGPAFNEADAAFRNLTIRGGSAERDGDVVGAGINLGTGSLLIEGSIVEANVAGEYGGGVAVFSPGSLTIDTSRIRGNEAKQGSAVFGAEGTHVEIVRSSLYANHASFQFGSAVHLRGTGTLTNSTLARNTVETEATGGVLFADGGPAVVESSTFAENDGYAIEGAPITLRNNLIKGPCGAGGFTSEGGNATDELGNCGLGSGESGVPIFLLTLGYYGGVTPTMPLEHTPNNQLFLDNPAAQPNCTATDQRGEVRPQDSNGDGVAICDSGAVEGGVCHLSWIKDDTILSFSAYSSCVVRAGPNLAVMGPSGHLALSGLERVEIWDGFEVLTDGTLRVANWESVAP